MWFLAWLLSAIPANAYIKDLYLVEGKSTDCPWGYDRVNTFSATGDLNERAGGKYLWLCQQTTPSIEDLVITGLVLQSDPDCDIELRVFGFNPIMRSASANGDLNQGAGGKYIYLCATRFVSNSTQNVRGALKSLTIIGGEATPCPRGSHKVDVYGEANGDLNQGVLTFSYLWLCADFEPFPPDVSEFDRTTASWLLVADAFNGDISRTVSEGTRITDGSTLTSTWSESFTAGVQAGVKFLTVSMNAEFSSSTAQSISSSITKESSVSCSVTCPREEGMHAWAYQWAVSGYYRKDSTKPDGVTYTCSYRCVYTSGAEIAPQCPYGACNDPFCTAERCLDWKDPKH